MFQLTLLLPLMFRYKKRLLGKMKVVLLTNDAENRRKALSEGLEALGVAAFARSLKDEV